jgi:hypothetical protein
VYWRALKSLIVGRFLCRVECDEFKGNSECDFKSLTGILKIGTLLFILIREYLKIAQVQPVAPARASCLQLPALSLPP